MIEDLIENIIVTGGGDSVRAKRDDWAVIGDLRVRGHSDEAIIEAFSKRPGGAPAWLAEYLEGLEAKETEAFENDEVSKDRDLAMMNSKYAVVQQGTSTVVFCFGPDGVPMYQSFENFKKFQNAWSKTYKVQKGDIFVETKVGRGDWWLDQCAGPRRQYDTTRFMPGSDKLVVNNILNLWTGFAVKSIEGAKHESFLRHIHDNLCGGSDVYYNYLILWMAHVVQRGGKPAGVAVVLKSESEGTGKSFFAKSFGRLFGKHFKHVVNADHLVGKFNSHMRDCRVMFADEAFYAGDRKHEGVLKAIITEERLMVELKGIDPSMEPNYMALIMASNLLFVVPAHHSARRYFVLEVLTTKMQDSVYFNSIQADLDDGGYESLLHFLQHLPLDGFDIRAVPKTEALAKQKELSLSAEDDWWKQLLIDGVLPGAMPGEPCSAYSKLLFEDARERFPKLAMTGAKRLANAIEDRGAEERRKPHARGWKFPPLPEARKAWIAKHGGTFIEPNANWGDAPTDSHPELKQAALGLNRKGGTDDIPF